MGRRDFVNVSFRSRKSCPTSPHSIFIAAIEPEMKAAIERVCKHFEAKQVKLSLLKWSLDISSSAMLRIKNVESIYFPNVKGEEAKKPTSEFFKYICGLSDFTFTSVMYAPLQGFIRECVPNSKKKKLEDIAQRLKDEFKVRHCIECVGREVTNGRFFFSGVAAGQWSLHLPIIPDSGPSSL
jgi:hypothetical protein